jgi:hypothetical protein
MGSNNTSIRTITKSPYNAHTAPLFSSLKILPYASILKQAKLHFMHSYVYNYAPKSFDNTWALNNQRTDQHDLRNNMILFFPTNPTLFITTNLE